MGSAGFGGRVHARVDGLIDAVRLMSPVPTRGTVPSVANLEAVADWLRRAQDVTSDGGLSWGYDLRRRWMPSYPETTGYIVPTLLRLADRLEAPEFVDRAERAVRFLMPLQLPNGAFPGGRVDENTTEPSVFNTGQIINGLLAWHRASDDDEALTRAERAADWLVSVQERDGAWRRHIYNSIPVTYTAFAAGWLAELAAHTGNTVHMSAAERHLDWVLAQQDPRTGWFDRAGFTSDDHERRIAVTHTIAYVLAGVLTIARTCGRTDALQAVAFAARNVAAALARHGWLPGVMDADWQPRARYACPTGTAQAALVWFALADEPGLAELVPVAERAVDLVTTAQQIGVADTGIRGGIPGSHPTWGRYLSRVYPNWPAKFYADALLADPRIVGRPQRA
jgi:hypothetical protein